MSKISIAASLIISAHRYRSGQALDLSEDQTAQRASCPLKSALIESFILRAQFLALGPAGFSEQGRITRRNGSMPDRPALSPARYVVSDDEGLRIFCVGYDM